MTVSSGPWHAFCMRCAAQNHAFTGSNFLSIVLKIVEGDTSSLPERYPRQLNASYGKVRKEIYRCINNFKLYLSILKFIWKIIFFLNITACWTSVSLRPSAIEILKLSFTLMNNYRYLKWKGYWEVHKTSIYISSRTWRCAALKNQSERRNKTFFKKLGEIVSSQSLCQRRCMNSSSLVP